MARSGFMGATLFDGPTGGLFVDDRRGAVAGTFADDTSSVGFEFSLDGDVRRAMLRGPSGDALVESTLADGIETTTYLGRLTIFGAPRDQDPRVVGDRTAMARLARRPEARLFQPLREALEARGVSRALYAAPKPPRHAAQPWQPVAAGEAVVVATWSWWWTVAVDVWSWSAPARYTLQDGINTAAETVHGWRRTTRPWSSWTVTVTNLYSSDAIGVGGTVL